MYGRNQFGVRLRTVFTSAMIGPITAAYLTVILLGLDALSIEKVSEKQNVTKREANAEFFPDWVPFKNKHGDELGEFVSVPKAKPKKRLAPPVNFILRAVAEPEGDDYYDKGQGETDGEEYFEKKEWSDLNRPADPIDNISTKQENHTDISDIEGIVDIISRPQRKEVEIILNALSPNNTEKIKNSEVSKESNEEDLKNDQTEAPKKAESKESKEEESEPEVKKAKKDEEEADYEEENNEKQKPESGNQEEQADSDARKASILDAVDELKERHAQEQKAISEKVKEEEIHKEEHERNLGNREELDKYDVRSRKKEDYDEYDEKELSVHEKYRLNSIKTTTTTKRPRKKSRKGKKTEEVGKLSVFKNPQLYMIYDDEEETTTTKKPSTRTRTKHLRFSSKFTTTTPEPEENVRISLVPQDTEAKEGEPTLFFPKTRKNKKRRKNKATTPEPDSSVAETIGGVAAKDLTTAEFPTGTTGSGTSATGSDVTGTGSDVSATGSDVGLTGSVASATGGDTTGTGTAPSGSDAVSTNSDAVGEVTDAVPASTDHKDAGKKNEDYEMEKG